MRVPLDRGPGQADLVQDRGDLAAAGPAAAVPLDGQRLAQDRGRPASAGPSRRRSPGTSAGPRGRAAPLPPDSRPGPARRGRSTRRWASPGRRSAGRAWSCRSRTRRPVPNVSPGRIVEADAGDRRTSPTLRCSTAPAVTGKFFTRSIGRSSTPPSAPALVRLATSGAARRTRRPGRPGDARRRRRPGGSRRTGGRGPASAVVLACSSAATKRQRGANGHPAARPVGRRHAGDRGQPFDRRLLEGRHRRRAAPRV